MSQPHILVVGSIGMDFNVRVSRLPAAGETVIGRECHICHGGKGGNQAVAAARLGARVSMIGCLGTDVLSDELAAGLQADGIDPRWMVRREGATAGIAIITVDAVGQNTISLALGANALLTPKDVEAGWKQIERPDIMIMPLESPVEAVEAAARLARSADVPLVFNPAPAPSSALPAPLMMSVDVLVLNETEAQALTGIMPDTPAQMERVAQSLLAEEVEAVVLTLGARGAWVFDGDEPGVEIAAHKVKAVDAVAAGDCYVGALAVEMARGASLVDAARYASAAAAVSVTRAGARPSLPTRAEVEQFLATI